MGIWCISRCYSRWSKSLRQKATTEQAKQEARENYSQGMVGTATLMTAVYYRAKNQDTEWY